MRKRRRIQSELNLTPMKNSIRADCWEKLLTNNDCVEAKMKDFDLFNYEVKIDETATKEWYANSHGWDCPCEDCKHFISLAKKRELPSVILDTLSQFEIAPEKATYVCSITEENNEVLYEISYRVVGNILKEKECDINDSGRGEAYCGHNLYPYGAPGFPEPHFDLEFWVWLPMLHSVAPL